MKIASAASAFPKHYYSQKQLLERLQDYWATSSKIRCCWHDCTAT